VIQKSRELAGPGLLGAVAPKEQELNELKHYLVHKKELKQFRTLITV
jgi:hypothetical protein